MDTRNTPALKETAEDIVGRCLIYELDGNHRVLSISGVKELLAGRGKDVRNRDERGDFQAVAESCCCREDISRPLQPKDSWRRSSQRDLNGCQHRGGKARVAFNSSRGQANTGAVSTGRAAFTAGQQEQEQVKTRCFLNGWRLTCAIDTDSLFAAEDTCDDMFPEQKKLWAILCRGPRKAAAAMLSMIFSRALQKVRSRQ